MPAPLVPVSLIAPGNSGLNTEGAAFVDEPRWSLRLDNGVIDSAGRVAARKGWTGQRTGGGSPTGTVVSVFEYIDSATSSEIVYSTATELWSGVATPTDVTGALSFTTGDWAFLNYNGKCVGVQGGEDPIVYSGATFASIVAASGSLPTGDVGLSAWGRLWVTDSDETTIKFSGLLDETDWGSAGAGSIDTLEVWPDGADSVVSLAAFNDRLVIFGNRSILIYVGPEDPTATTFQLEDIIQGHGCVGRDSVQHVGNDLLYLSHDGVRSLQRGIAYSTLPESALTDAVRSELVDDLSLLSTGTIKSGYSQEHAAYWLKVGSRYWYFNVRQLPQSGDIRPARWFGIGYSSMHVAQDGTIYLGQSGEVGTYGGYDDDGASYTFRWRSVWLNLGEAPRLFLPKRCRLTVISAASYNVILRWAQDYEESFSSAQQSLPTTSLTQWSGAAATAPSPEAEWSGDPDNAPSTLAEWSGAAAYVKRLDYDLSQEGDRWALEVAVDIDGSAFAIQRVDLVGKVGRLAA